MEGSAVMSSLPMHRGMLAFTLVVVPAVALGQTSTSSVSTSTAAEPQPTPSESGIKAAKVHFKAAKSHYRAGRYLEAIAEFKRAHDLSPRAAITYNIARCCT